MSPQEQRRRLGLAVLTEPMTGNCLRLHVWQREHGRMDSCSVIAFDGATTEDLIMVAVRLRGLAEQVERHLLDAVAQGSEFTVAELREVVTQMAKLQPMHDSISRMQDLPAAGSGTEGRADA